MMWRCHFCNEWKRPVEIIEVGITQYCGNCFKKHKIKFEAWKKLKKENCHPEKYMEEQ